MSIEEQSRNYCTELDVVYWKDALLGVNQRGSRVRVKPTKRMMKDEGDIKKVTVLGEECNVYFDVLYLEHYKQVTGIDFQLQFQPLIIGNCGIEYKKSSLKTDLTAILDSFLKDGNIEPSAKNPRHSLFLKFQTYLEEYHVN